MKALQITLLSLSFSLSSFSRLISFPSPHPSLPISHVFFVSQKYLSRWNGGREACRCAYVNLFWFSTLPLDLEPCKGHFITLHLQG